MMGDWLKHLDDTHKLDALTEEVYNELITYFDNTEEYRGYRGGEWRLPRPAVTENLKDIAEEIYGYFSAHYFKARHTFILQERLYQDSVLKNYPFTIIDIGCGIGTATYALMDLIRFRGNWENNDSKLSVKLIFVELIEEKAKLLKQCIESYKSKCNELSIQYEIINDSFPNCIDSIKNLVENDKNILAIMSNLVNWLNNDPQEMGKGIHKINMENPDIYDIRVVNIEGHKLEKQIKSQYEFLDNKGVYSINGPIEEKGGLKYLNAIKSYWYEIKGVKAPYIQREGYLHGNVRSIPLIKAIRSNSILELAFFKARHAHRAQIISDEIEIKYIEANLYNVIKLLQEELDQQHGYRYSSDFLEYEMPKNNQDFRPCVIEDFKNDIISASLLMTIGENVDEERDLLKTEEYSFGNRLIDQLRTPYIFQPFAQKYFKEYLAKAKEVSKTPSFNDCVQADIKSFYTRIDKELLKQIIDTTIPDKIPWVKYTLNSFLERVCLMEVILIRVFLKVSFYQIFLLTYILLSWME